MEVVALKVCDFHSKRMILRVEQGKGRKSLPSRRRGIALPCCRRSCCATSGDGAGRKQARTKQSRGGRGQPHRAAIEGTEEAIRAWFAMLMLPDNLQEEIRRPVADDRSKAIFRVVARLIELEHDDQTIQDIIYAHPKGIGEKYANRNDLDREIARVRNKTAGKPIVQIRGGALPEIVHEAERHLIEAEDDIFQRGSVIVRPGQTVITVAGGRKILATPLVPVRVHHMVERFSRVIDFQKLDMRSETWLSINCPRNIAETYLEREGQWRLPVLTGVISAPTLRPDGSVLEHPGYDKATGLLFDPQGIEFPPVPDAPTKEEAICALKELRTLLETFPFVDEQSRAVALSGILTTLIRPSLSSAPLHAFTAPNAGSGKSLLVDIASMIATGRETAVLAQGSTAEEFEKRIGAEFLVGSGTLSIDNCEQPLGGELLCQVTTQPSVKIRLLGQSKNVEVLTNATLFATGNNLRVVGDVTRRALVCSLDPECERPELREFATDPLGMIRQERGRYVVAALTVLRAFHIVGRPQQVSPLGSFGDWSNWVRDALIWAGEADPCTTMERARSEDPRLEKLRNLIHYWDIVIGTRRVSAAEVAEIAMNGFDSPADEQKSAQGGFREALLVVAGEGSMISSRKLGNWLGRHKGRVVDGAKIIADTVLTGLGQWQLVHVQ
jgi:putative DNA primase/helicase